MTWFVNITCIMLWVGWIASAVLAWIKTGRDIRERRQREFQQWQGTYEPLSLPRYDDLKPYTLNARNSCAL